MFFEKYFKILTSTVLFLGFVSGLSCSNDHGFKEEDPIVSLSYDSNCLSELSKTIELYAEELLSDHEIKKGFACVIDALDYVKVRVKGKTKGAYTELEAKNFLNKFLFKEKKKGASFFKKLFLIKKQFLGGSVETLSFSDLDVLKTFLIEAEPIALKLKPFVSELLFKEAFLEESDINIVVAPVAQFLAKWISFQKGNLDIQVIFDFLKEVDFEIKAQKSLVGIFNLLRSVDADQTLVTYDEKLPLVRVFKSYYVEILDLNRALEGDWEYERSKFFEFAAKADVFLISVLESLKKHPKKHWSAKDLKHFVNLLSVYEVFGAEVSEEVQEHVIHVLFEKYFSNSNELEVLNEENFQKLISSWAEIRKFLIDAKSVEGHKGIDFPFVQEGNDAFSVFTQRKWPSLVGNKRSIFIPDYAPEVEFSFQSLFHRGWQFQAAKLLIQTYSEDQKDFGEDSGLTLDQVKEAYIDVFILLKEIGFLDEESRGGWFRIFNEGNIFVPSAVSNEFVSYSEAADYAAYMFSAYFAGKQTSEFLENKCLGGNEECSFTYVLKEPQNTFVTMPGLWDYFSVGMPVKSYNRWQQGFEYIAKLTNDDSPYEKSNWFRGAVVSQYVEVIYRKYDLDRSDTLSFEEVSLAYVDFKEALRILPLVKGTSAENDDATLKSFLTLFVKDGKAPRLRNGRPRGSLVRHVLLCGGVYTSTNRVCTFESDRSKIMSLLAYLTKVSAE